jgi:hypothetical protein
MSTTSPSPHRAYEDTKGGAWSYGIVIFAGVMLVTVAAFQILEGIAAVAKDEVFVTGVEYVYKLDVTTWGWVHIVLGAIGVATGLGLLAGQTWARVTGIALAVIGAVANFAFLPYYPLWTLVLITFYVLVIWALTAQMRHS